MLRTICAFSLALVIVFTQTASAQNRPGPGGRGEPGASRPGGGASAPAAAPSELTAWIDTHTHLRPGPNGLFLPAVRSARDAMSLAKIRTMVLEPQPFPDSDSNGRAVYDYESFLQPMRLAPPGTFAFLGGNSLNQMLAQTPANAVTDAIRAEFTRQAEAIIQAGAAGFGEIGVTHLSRVQGHPYQSVPADHPLLLLMAEIAGRNGKLIDVHMDFFDRDAPPPRAGTPNPSMVTKNTDGLERLLSHDRNARILLAHFGSDYTGQWSVAAARRLLAAHANLYLSIKLGPNPPSGNGALTASDSVKPDWLALLTDFPDRFVIGSDSFFAPPSGRSDFDPAPYYKFLLGLPPELRRKIAADNAARLYGLAN